MAIYFVPWSRRGIGTLLPRKRGENQSTQRKQLIKPRESWSLWVEKEKKMEIQRRQRQKIWRMRWRRRQRRWKGTSWDERRGDKGGVRGDGGDEGEWLNEMEVKKGKHMEVEVMMWPAHFFLCFQWYQIANYSNNYLLEIWTEAVK